jgi:predicted transcriptional regulator
MAIGIVSNDDFARELERLNSSSKVNSVVKQEVVIEDIPSKGRNDGDVNVPESLRKVIGATHATEGREAALQLANMFGISDSSVSAYANGSTSTKSYHNPVKNLREHINKRKERVSKRAFGKMNDALQAINPDKLSDCNARELASVAKDMSVIIKNMEPPPAPINEGDGNKPQFIIFAPQFKKEEHYETITVDE